MKHIIWIMTLFLAAGSILEVSAIHSSSGMMAAPEAPGLGHAVTVQDFLAMDMKGYRTADGRKMSWFQRLAMKMTQKSLAKKVKQGKIDVGASLASVISARNPNIHGLLSVIFTAVGLFIPYFGLAAIVAGLILGIIGIRRDADPTLAIIGTVVSGLVLLAGLILFAVVLRWVFFFGR